MKSVLVLDTGIAVEEALRLSRNYKVYYWTHYFSAFPEIKDFLPGCGFDEIEKVDNIGSYIDEVDLIATFDIGYGDLISYFRSKGKVAFGAGKGEKMETDRVYLKEQIKKRGLDPGPYAVVKGMDELEKYLKEHKEVFVKLNTFRGDMETLYCPSLDIVLPYLDLLSIRFSGIKDKVWFIVEEKIDDGIEIGIDGIFSPSTGFLLPIMWGIEIGSAYIGRWDVKLPQWFKRTAVPLSVIMKELDYRGFISTEQIVVEKGEDYLIDITSRIPHPLGHIFTSAILNYPEVIEKVARNERVIPLVRHRWWGCMPLYSSDLKDSTLEVSFPEEIRDSVKFSQVFRNNGKYYVPRGSSPLCSVIAGGGSIEEVKKKIRELVKKVEAVRIERDTSVLDAIEEEWEKLKKKLKIKGDEW